MLVDNHLTRPHVSMLGTSALLFEAPGEFSLATQRRIWTLARTAAAWPGVREAAPCMTNVMLTFDTPPEEPERLEEALLAAWRPPSPTGPKAAWSMCR